MVKNETEKSIETRDDVINSEIEEEHSYVNKKREIEIGTQNYTKIVAVGEKGAGGANHYYRVINNTQSVNSTPEVYAAIDFQNGPIKEKGINGCHNEDLIAVVIDRLQCFQSGEFSCRENAIAITKLEEALLWLNKRTNDRIKRGVEGKSIV